MVAHLDAHGRPLPGRRAVASTCSADGASARSTSAIDRRVLIPRPETELVAGVAIELAARRAGAASGRRPRNRVRRDRPVAGSRAAARRDDGLDHRRRATMRSPSHDQPGRDRPHRRATCESAQGSWFEALPAGERFDVIVSNPPYVAEGSPDLDARCRVGAAARRCSRVPTVSMRSAQLVAGARRTCAPGGWLVLEIGADQGPAVRSVARRRRLRARSRSGKTWPATIGSRSPARSLTPSRATEIE